MSERMLDRTELSRAISHALRHEPWLYELELDGEGWASMDALIAVLRSMRPQWGQLSRSDVEQVVVSSDKRRHEIVGDRIRALYGHSLPGRLLREPRQAPAVLFHGTSPNAAEQILLDGLKPMGRQYVHLSVDRETARQVGGRKTPSPIILKVDAFGAHAVGVVFYAGNEKVWLTDFVPARFVNIS